MLKRLFDTREVDELAAWLAGEMKKRLPPAEALSPRRKTSERLARLDEELAGRVAALVRAGGLNVYKKAMLGSRVQSALDAAGYPAEFSKRYVMDLVSLAAVARRGPP